MVAQGCTFKAKYAINHETRVSANVAKVVIPGTYVVRQIMLYASRIILSYEPENTSQSTTPGSRFFKCPLLLLHQRPDAFDMTLSASRHLYLDRNRFVEIELSSGRNNVRSSELHIRAATAGLRLQTSDLKVVDNRLEVSNRSEAGVIRFGALQSESKVKIMVPFSLENDVNDISLKLEISYTTEKGTFFLAKNPSISIMLPLGVNVQDIFKHKALFSKFTISSSTRRPLRLLKSRLEPSNIFQASNGGDLPNPVMIFPHQPASLLYKITRRFPQAAQTRLSNKKDKSSLSLVIYYVCLEEEIDNAVTSALSEALSETPLHQFNRFIIPTVLRQLGSRISSYILEQTALTGNFPTSVLLGIGWRELFSGLGKHNGQEDMAALLARWIQTWCEERPYIQLQPLDVSEEMIAKSRSIIIPVDVPSITAVHTADIKILYKSPTRGEVIATVNEPIPASLEIKSTRTWDSSPLGGGRSSQSRAGVSEIADDIEFVFEVSAPADMWLVGGTRKGHFRIPSSKDKAQVSCFNFPIILIPMKEGYLPYPHLEIKPSSFLKPAAADDRGGSNRPTPADEASKAVPATSETDYKNMGETIRVIRNARKTTVSLDASGPQGGAWLLESEMRVAQDGVFIA